MAPARLQAKEGRGYPPSMSKQLNIVVTGTSRGIGAGIRAALPGHKVVGQSTKGGEGALASDFADPEQVAAFWRQAMDMLGGRVDVLVNNAGMFEATPIEQDDEAWLSGWERTMQVNLTASAALCRLAVLHFRENGGGRIVNVASRAAYRGDSPQHWHYAASKAGMVAMTKTIARGYAAENILAFAVCPGFTMTGMAEDYVASRGGEKLLADIPLGRVAAVEEVAETVRWLAVDAPPSATGAVIDVNGASYVR
jgi:NAD(P)-dependent dehydrogenase (short-subunit alcohol dehydrogenase family)